MLCSGWQAAWFSPGFRGQDGSMPWHVCTNPIGHGAYGTKAAHSVAIQGQPLYN